MKSQLVPLNIIARRLCVSQKWLRNEAESGRLPHVKADATLLFNTAVVEKILLDRASEPAGEMARK